MLSVLYFQCFRKRTFIFLYPLDSLTTQRAPKCQERMEHKGSSPALAGISKRTKRMSLRKKPQEAKTKLANPLNRIASGWWREEVMTLFTEIFLSPLAPAQCPSTQQQSEHRWGSGSKLHCWHLTQQGTSQSNWSCACLCRYSSSVIRSGVPTATFCLGWQGQYEERREKLEYSAQEGITMWKTALSLPSWSGEEHKLPSQGQGRGMRSF